MARTTLIASATAVLAAAAVGAGVIGSPVGSASAAAPFSITKSQYNQVKTTASNALKKSNANAKEIKALAEPTGEPMTPAPTAAAARTAVAEAMRVVRAMTVSLAGGCVICTRPTGGGAPPHGPFVKEM